MEPIDVEEQFHKQYRKETKTDRKKAQNQDRSKYKKSNLKETVLGKRTGKIARVIALSPIQAMCDGKLIECSLKGIFKKERTRKKNLLAVGDIVHLDETQIAFIEERYSLLSRADNLHRRKEQLIAVNVDQVFITVSAHEPTFKPALIDRYLIMAKSGNMTPIIVVNKCDLIQDPILIDECEATYTELGIPFIRVSAKENRLDQLLELMKGKTSVFSGQSGVGKTSLINALTGLSLATAKVVERTQKGSHTTTSASLIPLEGEAFVVDTPGIKSFGLWNITELEPFFPDIAKYSPSCKFRGCTHTHEPDCAVQEALDKGYLSLLRYDSFCTLQADL